MRCTDYVQLYLLFVVLLVLCTCSSWLARVLGSIQVYKALTYKVYKVYKVCDMHGGSRPGSGRKGRLKPEPARGSDPFTLAKQSGEKRKLVANKEHVFFIETKLCLVGRRSVKQDMCVSRVCGLQARGVLWKLYSARLV